MEKSIDLPGPGVRVVIYARPVTGSKAHSFGQELVARRVARRNGWNVVGPVMRSSYDEALGLASRSGASLLLIALSNCLDGAHEPFVANVRSALAFDAALAAAKAARR